jgi:metal-responsive CopG/Arc/MetJ family transcriptional regulator
MSKDVKKVSIPVELYKKVKEAVKDSDVDSVEEFIVKALEAKLGDDPGLSDDEEEKVKERLKALGYMD